MARYHVVSIHIRRQPGDRAYVLRESFHADTLAEAARTHLAYRAVSCSYVLRDSQGHRYSLADSRESAKVAA